MVGIRGVGAGAAARAGRWARGARGGFSLGAGAETSGAAAAQATAGPAAVGLLALQEAGPVAERDARARRRGEGLLRELAGLQADLLAGRADPARLRAIAALAEGETPADPALAGAIAAIALRARIELARRGME